MNRVLIPAILWGMICPSLIAAEQPAFRVVGYLPDYRVAEINPAIANTLTDLIFFSVLPEPEGTFRSKVLDDPRTVETLKTFRQHGVKLHLCVGGWDRSQKFPEISAAAETRKRFIAGALAFCQQRGFTGIDLDWEHPANDDEQRNYGYLLRELAVAFHADRREVSLAMAGWQKLSEQALNAVDGIHLMSYDAPVRHSTFEQAEKDVQGLLNQHVLAAKIRLGVPFYGRGITERDRVMTYGEIVRKFQPSPDADEADGISFNGPRTIQRKVTWANEQRLGGVMIWELGQDAPGDLGLLKVIRKTVQSTRTK